MLRVVVVPILTPNGTCAVRRLADTKLKGAGVPSKVTCTPPRLVGRLPAGAATEVPGPRLAPAMLTSSPGAATPDWKPAVLYTACGAVIGMVFCAEPLNVTEN